MRQQGNQSQANMGAAIALLALQIGGAITEQADERQWRTLPAHVTVARGRLECGQRSVVIDTGTGRASFDVNLTGPYALVTVRFLGGRSFVAPAASPSVPSAPLPAGAESARADGDGTVQVSVLNFDYPVAVPTPRRTVP